LILFLDFDGVLHPLFVPVGPRRGRAYEGPTLIHADLLSELLAPHLGDTEIVIASNWARRLSSQEICQLLPRPLSDRVTGSVWDEHATTSLSRYELITGWLLRHRPNHSDRWLALDDDARGWPDSERRHLVWCAEPINSRSIQAELLCRLGDL